MNKKHILLNEHLRNLFKERVQRIPLDPGFTCPNRIEAGGCIFCDERGSAAPWIEEGMSIREQLQIGAKYAYRRYKAEKFIAYFQAFTTTSGPLEALESMYDEAVSFPGVVGVAVATRPDAVDENVMNLLEDLSRKTYLWVELGVQSMHAKSLEWMHRGHDVQTFKTAVSMFHKKNIEVVGHIIFGLPTESRDEMLSSFTSFIETGIDGYKIHALHIIKDTQLARLYKDKPFELLTMEEYIDLVREALTLTPYGTVIHRLTGEVSRDRLIAPIWVLKKNEILRRILA